MLIRSSAVIVLQKEDRTPLRDIIAESIRDKAILHLIILVAHSRTIKSWMLCCDQRCEPLVHDRCWWTPPYWWEQDIWCEWSVLQFDNSYCTPFSYFSWCGKAVELSHLGSDHVELRGRLQLNSWEHRLWRTGLPKSSDWESGRLLSIVSHGSTILP